MSEDMLLVYMTKDAREEFRRLIALAETNGHLHSDVASDLRAVLDSAEGHGRAHA